MPVDSHFFDDLGADSMLMARFCAKLRKRPDLPTVSIKDVYRHTTITAPGRRVRPSGHPGPPARTPRPAREHTPEAPAFPDPATARMSRSKPHFFLCGLLQTAVAPRLPGCC